MVSIGFHFGAKTSRYGPYELGYRRATKAKQNDAIPSRNYSFHFSTKKMEGLIFLLFLG